MFTNLVTYEMPRCHDNFIYLACSFLLYSGNSRTCLIDRNKKEETLHDLTCHATVHQHMKTADVCHNAMPMQRFLKFRSVSSDQNIRDHLWSWSSHFGQPKFADCAIFDKPVHHCHTFPHLWREFGKESKLVRARSLLARPGSHMPPTYLRFSRRIASQVFADDVHVKYFHRRLECEVELSSFFAGKPAVTAWDRLCRRFFLDLFSVFVGIKTCPCWIWYKWVQFQIEICKISRGGSRSPNNAEFGHFTLFYRGRQRNVPRIITHLHSYRFALQTCCLVTFSLPLPSCLA